MNPDVNDVIEIRGFHLDAIVGVLDEERHHAQPLEFDIDVYRSFALAAKNDDLTQTTNYAALVTLCGEIAINGGFLLLETLAHRVGEGILAFDAAVTSVQVSVRKLRPPVAEDVATLGVRCTLSR